MNIKVIMSRDHVLEPVSVAWVLDQGLLSLPRWYRWIWPSYCLFCAL